MSTQLTTEEFRVMREVAEGGYVWSTIAEALAQRGLLSFSKKFDCYVLTPIGQAVLEKKP